MSAGDAGASTITPPAGAGLTPGTRVSDDKTPEGPKGQDLLDATAEGRPPTEDEQFDLLGYFLTNQGLPGDDEAVPMGFEMEDEHGRVRQVTWKIRRVTWESWQDAIEHATSKDGEVNDAYMRASWVVARALVDPKLGPAVKQMRAEAEAEHDGKLPGPDGSRIDPPVDAAGVLRRMFRQQSGVLVQLSAQVLEHSKLVGEGAKVRLLNTDIAAGKD